MKRSVQIVIEPIAMSSFSLVKRYIMNDTTGTIDSIFIFYLFFSCLTVLLVENLN